jgi:uncharacterized protein (TIGR04562 family)
LARKHRPTGNWVVDDLLGTAADVPWDALKAIVGGQSAVDEPRLDVNGHEGAQILLESYGFDCSRGPHRAELETLRRQAILFVREELLGPDLSLQLPSWLDAETDVRQLMLLASRRPVDDFQRWSCALLRVMHTIVHCHSYFNQRFGDEIREQILRRFEPHVRGHDATLRLGDGDLGVPLTQFEVKHVKPWRSVTMKLLHKPENVAADVFDRIGIRFVTKERFDALLVMRYLRSHYVVLFANVKPSRSRNTLIDLDALRENQVMLDQLRASGRLTDPQYLAALRECVRDMPYPEERERAYNPFSAVQYHSIQFTCRQLIRIVEQDATMLSGAFPAVGRSDVTGGEVRFFFPYEVQILDQDSWDVSRSGLAAHEVYKARQRASVRRRVLGSLLPR